MAAERRARSYPPGGAPAAAGPAGSAGSAGSPGPQGPGGSHARIGGLRIMASRRRSSRSRRQPLHPMARTAPEARPGAPDAAPAARQQPALAPDAGPRSAPWRWPAALAGVALLAAAVRLAVAAELSRVALFATPQLDSREFLLWAGRIARGDLAWPALPAHGPGYPYLLGALLAAGGGSLTLVRVVQALLGAGTAVAAAALGRRAFGTAAGVAAGVLLALYAPLVLVDVSILAEGPFLFLMAVALWCLAVDRPALGAAACGLALGAAAVFRATALPLVAALALVVLLDRRRPRRVRDSLLLVGAALLVVLPVVVRVRQATGAWLPIQGAGSLNLYLGNRPGGGFASARPGSGWDLVEGGALRAGVTNAGAMDRFYLRRLAAEVAADPGGWLRTQGRKLVALVQADEVRDTHSFAFFRDRSPLLRWLPDWGWLLPLGAAGIWLAARRHRLPPALTVYLGVSALVCWATVVGLRYRLPIVPALAVFAGLGLAGLAEAVRARRPRELAWGCGILAVAAVVCHLRGDAASHDFAEEWALSAAGSLSRDDMSGAEGQVAAALAADRRSALAWAELAELRLRQGRWDEAASAATQAAALAPDFQLPHLQLGLVARHRGDLAAALPELRRAVWLRPDDQPSLATLGEVLVSRGETAEAERVYRQLLAATPGDPGVHLALARLAGARGDFRAGVALALRATGMQPDNADGWLLAALLALDAHDTATAARALGSAQDLLGVDAPAVGVGWAMLDRQEGRPLAAEQRCRDILLRQPGFGPAARLLVASAAGRGHREEAERFLAGLATASRPR
jgi:tetratricopeptide (TPR) repeat protein